MGSALAGYKRATATRREDPEDEEEDVHPALRKLRREAADRGATLASGGKGGMPAESVLAIMRRDGYRCKRCGGVEDLSIHHKGRHLSNVRAALTRIPREDPKSAVTMCEGCHDMLHSEDRAGHGGPGDDPQWRRKEGSRSEKDASGG